MQTQTAVEPTTFREVLGHFPTGIVLITAIDEAGEPVGMVVGSFTSVSLDPPLVAFLPMKTSRTYARIRTATAFCVNVLAAGQEHLCRHFAGGAPDKFASVGWRPGPSGAPVLDGVVAWIDCDLDHVVDGGDHDVVFGRVRELAVESPVLPLLFFQGGYGRFTPQSMVIPSVPELLGATRLADELSPYVDRVARDLGAECSLIVPEAGDAVFVAGANYSVDGGWTRLGTRIPLVAPLGPLFVGAGNAVSDEDWLSRLGRIDDGASAHARRQLETVRARDWSILLRGAVSPTELDEAVAAYSSHDRTPLQERQLVDLVKALADLHEPEGLEPGGTYSVMQVSVPVRDGAGRTVAALRLSSLPTSARLAEIEGWVDRLREVANARSCRSGSEQAPQHVPAAD